MEPRAVEARSRALRRCPARSSEPLPELEPALVLAPHEIAPPRVSPSAPPRGVRGVRGRHRALDHGDALVEFDEFGSPSGSGSGTSDASTSVPAMRPCGGLLLLVLVLSTRGWSTAAATSASPPKLKRNPPLSPPRRLPSPVSGADDLVKSAASIKLFTWRNLRRSESRRAI